MIRYFLIIFFLFCALIQVSGQPTKGSAASHFNDQNYEIALKQYLRLIKKDKSDPEIITNLGLCYLYTEGDKTEAIPYLEHVDRLPDSDKKIHLELGKAYFYANEFSKATKTINEFLKNPGEKTDESVIAEAKHYLEYIENAKFLMNSPLDVTFINLGENVNSKMSEFYPFITLDEKELLFTSNKKYISDFEVLVKNIYYTTPYKDSWMKAKSIGSKANTDEDETIVGMLHNGDMLLIYANTLDSENDIIYSERKRGRYRETISFGSNINTRDIEMGATITNNLDTLYFASNRPGGKGGFDIYYSVRLPNGTFGIPHNMGDTINTIYDDNFPNLSNDGKTLYFSSKGHNSMGGYDIFKSRGNADGKWTEPVNFGYPVNNLMDNEIISFPQDERYAYISAYRKDSYGYRDIYKIIFNDIEAERIVYTGTIAVGDSINPVKLSDVDADISMTVYKNESEDVYGIYSCSKNTGRYALALPPGKYDLVITGESYLEYRQKFEVLEHFHETRVFTNNIYLKKKL